MDIQTQLQMLRQMNEKARDEKLWAIFEMGGRNFDYENPRLHKIVDTFIKADCEAQDMERAGAGTIWVQIFRIK